MSIPRNKLTINKIGNYILSLYKEQYSNDEINNKIKIISTFIIWMSDKKLISAQEKKELLQEIETKRQLKSNLFGNAQVQASAASIPTYNLQTDNISDNKLSQSTRTTEGPKFVNISSDKNIDDTGFYSLASSYLMNKYVYGVTLAVFLILSTIVINRNLFKHNVTPTLANENVSKGRTLSFSGIITDNVGNPITDKTDVTFNLYSSLTSKTSLYTGACKGVSAITPDHSGQISVIIGSDCGMTPIPSSVFIDNPNLYIGLTIGDDNEMKPRKKVPNVGYAINSDKLQGLTKGINDGSIPYINDEGNLLIASNNPSIDSIYTSSNFRITSAQTLTLQASNEGDVRLVASQSGAIRFITGSDDNIATKMIVSPEGMVGIGTLSPTQALNVVGNIYAEGGQVRLGNFSFAPAAAGLGSMYYDTTANNIYYYNGLEWSPLGKDYLDTTGSSLYVKNTNDNFFVGGDSTSSAKFAFLNLNSSTPVASFSGDLILNGGANGIGTDNRNKSLRLGTASTGSIILAPNGNQVLTASNLGFVGIGTPNPTEKLDVSGNATISGNLTIGNGSLIQSNYGPLSLAFKKDFSTWTAGLTLQDTTGNVGIGTTSPLAKLDVQGTIRIDTTPLAAGNTNALCHTGAGGPNSDIGDCPDTPADYAEMYGTESDVTIGDIVTTGENKQGYPVLKKSTKAYDSSMIGIVSALPSQTIGNVLPDDLHPLPIALAGRVPVKITLSNGAIQSGDFITTSDVAGVGMKQTKASFAIGKSLEDYDGRDQHSQLVQQFITDVQKEIEKDSRGNTDENKKKLQNIIDTLNNPLPSNEGWIMVFVNSTWSDPTISIASNGDAIKNTTNGNDSLQLLTNSSIYNSDSIFTKILNATSIITDSIKSNIIESENSIVNNLLTAKNITAENISSQTAQFLASTSQTLNASIANITFLNITGNVVSPVIETGDITATGTANLAQIKTNSISPQGDTLEINLNSELQNQKGKLAQLVVKGLNGKKVAGVDETGNATFSGSLVADSLRSNDISAATLSAQTATVSGTLAAGAIQSDLLGAKDASISGTVIAKNIQADNIDALEQKVQQLQTTANNTNTSNADLAKQINDVQALLGTIKNQAVSNPSVEQNLAKSTELLDINHSDFSNILVSNNANLYNAYVSNSLTSGNILIQDNSILSLSSELKLSALSNINFFDGAVMIAKDGTITTKGTLVAKGGIKTNKIESPDSNSNVAVVLNSSKTDNTNVNNTKFQIQNTSGSEVASIDASGSAHFNELSLDKYMKATESGAIIASSANFDKNGIYAPAIETQSQTAGIGILPSGSREVIIYNSSIKDDSLIYLTSASASPLGNIGVVKKESCTETTENCKPYFKVAIDVPVNQPVQFNWLVIN